MSETMTEAEIRAMLQTEFDQVFVRPPSSLPFFPHVVVFLSAPQDVTRPTEDDAHEMSAENLVRAMYSVLLLESEGGSNSTILLNGETEQLPAMKRLVEGFGCRQYLPINSGDRGKSHTGTQFVQLANWLREQPFNSTVGIVLVTSQYHVPRVRRYAAKHISRGDYKWQVVGVPNDVGLYDREKKVAGEIDRIIKYSKDGTFDLFPDLGEGNS